MKRFAGRLLRGTGILLLAAAIVCACIEIALALAPYPSERFAPETVASRRYLDRNGKDLRVEMAAGGGRALWRPHEEMGPWVPTATIAVEDRRFRRHIGVDPIGILRAARGNFRSARVVEGGSTITQQLARLLDTGIRWHGRRGLGGRWTGRWRGKIREIWDALRIERSLTKDEILAQYLNRAPYGNRTTGIAAAAAQYFGKTPDRLSLAEAAYLAGLPQAPDALSPYRHPARAARRGREVLERMRAQGMIDETTCRAALAEEIRVRPPRPAFRAPHFLAEIDAGALGPIAGDARDVRTTIDLDLQNEVEGLLASHVADLGEKNLRQAACVVLDARTGEILAWVGSPDFFDPRAGEVDGVLAPRQPGSTLKSFTYALALEEGKTPATILADVPVEDLPDGFRPENYDGKYRGPVRLREALASSYNIPAVRVLQEIGPERLLDFLRRAGFRGLDREASHYGLALTLGAGEVRLLDLAAAYAIFARGGTRVVPRGLFSADGEAGGGAGADGERLLSPEACAQITSILSDDEARRPAFGRGGPLAFAFPVAAKTGTSKDFRDNWCVGYTPRHVVAVWAGSFDGTPMRGSSGVTGAAPLFHDIMTRVGAFDGAFSDPGLGGSPGLVALEICPLSGDLPGPSCPGRIREVFRAGNLPARICGMHLGDGDRTLVRIPARFRPTGFRSR